MAITLSKVIVLGALLLSFSSSSFSKQSFYVIPSDISNDCVDHQLYKTVSSVGQNSKCSLEIMQKSVQLIKLVTLCFQGHVVVPHDTCKHVISNLEVALPLYNKVLLAANPHHGALEIDFDNYILTQE
jgi:hypothetical protein